MSAPVRRLRSSFVKASAAQVMTDGLTVSGFGWCFGGAFGGKLGGQGSMGFANTRSYESTMCWERPNEMPQIWWSAAPADVRCAATTCIVFPVSFNVAPRTKVNKSAPINTFRQSHRGWRTLGFPSFFASHLDRQLSSCCGSFFPVPYMSMSAKLFFVPISAGSALAVTK